MEGKNKINLSAIVNNTAKNTIIQKAQIHKQEENRKNTEERKKENVLKGTINTMNTPEEKEKTSTTIIEKNNNEKNTPQVVSIPKENTEVLQGEIFQNYRPEESIKNEKDTKGGKKKKITKKEAKGELIFLKKYAFVGKIGVAMIIILVVGFLFRDSLFSSIGFLKANILGINNSISELIPDEPKEIKNKNNEIKEREKKEEKTEKNTNIHTELKRETKIQEVPITIGSVSFSVKKVEGTEKTFYIYQKDIYETEEQIIKELQKVAGNIVTKNYYKNKK